MWMSSQMAHSLWTGRENVTWIALVSETSSASVCCPNSSSSFHLKEKITRMIVWVCERGAAMGGEAARGCFLWSQMERGIWPNDFIPRHFTSQHLSWPQSTSSLRLPSMRTVNRPLYWWPKDHSIYWSCDFSLIHCTKHNIIAVTSWENVFNGNIPLVIWRDVSMW